MVLRLRVFLQQNEKATFLREEQLAAERERKGKKNAKKLKPLIEKRLYEGKDRISLTLQKIDAVGCRQKFDLPPELTASDVNECSKKPASLFRQFPCENEHCNVQLSQVEGGPNCCLLCTREFHFGLMAKLIDNCDVHDLGDNETCIHAKRSLCRHPESHIHHAL